METLLAEETLRGYRADFPNHTGPPIFVSGCNRGGTTILTRLLAAHPEVRNVGRGEFCEGQYIWRKRFRDRSRHRWAVWPWRLLVRRTAAHATRPHLGFFQHAFHDAMRGPGRMLEKTPANAVRVPFINALYPDCYFLHVLRDGRHTTASLVARRVNLLFAPHQWVGAHRTALADLASLPPERVIFVRHEELVENPEGVLHDICRRCDLSLEARDRDALDRVARELVERPDCRWDRFRTWKKRRILSVIENLQRELGYPTTF